MQFIMHCYKYAEGVYVSVPHKKQTTCNKSMPFEKRVESSNLNAIDNMFNDLEKRTEKLIESNSYLIKDIDLDKTERNEILEENDNIILKNLERLNFILTNLNRRIPYNELCYFKERLSKLEKEYNNFQSIKFRK